MAAERRFDALGTSVEVSLPDDAEPLLDQVEQRIRAFEALWSRFRGGSELSNLNAAGGAPVAVAPETRRILRLAVEAHERTDGIFDPRVLRALEALGYAASRESLVPDVGPLDMPASGAPTPDIPRLALAIEFDEDGSHVTLPVGDRWDLGGIGKGFAADLLTEELAAQGVESIMVNLGGDIRVFGDAPGEPCWTVQVDDPMNPGRPLADVHLHEGGVATSGAPCGRRQPTSPQ